MSIKTDLEKLRSWKIAAEQLMQTKLQSEPFADAAPEPEPAASESGELVQLNIRISPALRRRVSMLTARDELSRPELLEIALGLYEEKFGRAE